MIELQNINEKLTDLIRAFVREAEYRPVLHAHGIPGIQNAVLGDGEQQRVSLARLMVKKCDIIFADEPKGFS